MTISRVAANWYISVSYEFEAEPTVKNRNYPSGERSRTVGVDVGVKVLATCSDGTVFENPRAYKKATKKLARLQRELNRRQLGSANRNKTSIKLAKAHQRIANIRFDAIHQLTSWLCKNHAVIGLAESWRCRFPSRQTFQEEDLNVAGMMKNHKNRGCYS